MDPVVPMIRSAASSILLVAWLVGCSDATAPSGPAAEIAGGWLFELHMTDQALDVTCQASGTGLIEQATDTFDGTLTLQGFCEGPGGSASLSGTDSIANGRAGATQLRFNVSGCTLQGSFIGAPPNGATGSISCVINDQGVIFRPHGTWQMTRGVASMQVEPESLGVTLDTTGAFAVTLLDPAGEVVSRQLTWSSDAPMAASVDADGRVRGLNPGPATITITTVPVYSLERPVSAQMRVGVVLRFVAVRAGVEHTCAVTGTGRGFCWGWNTDGRVGTGTVAESLPGPVTGGLRFGIISAGMVHTCGLTSAGTAYCWGDGVGGSLGDGVFHSVAAPLAVPNAPSFASVHAGTYSSCALTAAGAAYCWGSNQSGELGRGTIGGLYHLPDTVVGGHRFAQLSTTLSPGGGALSACGVTTIGEGYCWGYEGSGKLGDGGIWDSGTPVLVAGGYTWKTISVGWAHACGLTTDGTAYCWGYALSGALGTGSQTPVDQRTPALVSGGYTWSAINVGASHSCGITTTGAAYCWGDGFYNQLGNGTRDQQLAPTPVAGGLTFTTLSGGGYHTCGLATDGYLYCWGAGDRGQLGIAQRIARATPTRVGRQ